MRNHVFKTGNLKKIYAKALTQDKNAGKQNQFKEKVQLSMIENPFYFFKTW